MTRVHCKVGCGCLVTVAQRQPGTDISYLWVTQRTDVSTNISVKGCFTLLYCRRYWAEQSFGCGEWVGIATRQCTAAAPLPMMLPVQTCLGISDDLCCSLLHAGVWSLHAESPKAAYVYHAWPQARCCMSLSHLMRQGC